MVNSMRAAVLGLVALAALTGCATGTASMVGGNGNGMASPTTSENAKCEGWYDAAVGACDSMGD